MHLIAAGVAAAIAAVVYAVDPASSGIYPPCIFHSLTGLQCPGCGGTRALHQLLHGNIGAAFRLNPMLFVLIAVAPVVALRPSITVRPWFGWTAAGTLIAWGMLRNLM